MVLLDVLRNQSVDEHPCLQARQQKFCGLGPSHPANIGKFVYNFSDPELNILGSSTQTLTGGICLDTWCDRLTTVTLHNSSCFYTADLNGADALGSLSNLVTTLTSVEEVDISRLNESVDANVTHYGIVRRDNERQWEAEGYRGVSCKVGVQRLVVVCRVVRIVLLGKLTPHVVWVTDGTFA